MMATRSNGKWPADSKHDWQYLRHKASGTAGITREAGSDHTGFQLPGQIEPSQGHVDAVSTPARSFVSSSLAEGTSPANIIRGGLCVPKKNRTTGRVDHSAAIETDIATKSDIQLPAMQPDASPTLTFRWLSSDAVLARYPFTRQMLKRMMDKGEFPKSFRLGERKVAWRSDELDAWDAARQRADVIVYVPSANTADSSMYAASR
jgi:predicted DNA-binding transcriptional regulator AlpA